MEEVKPGLIVGKIYLIPTTLGDNAPLEVLPISVNLHEFEQVSSTT